MTIGIDYISPAQASRRGLAAQAHMLSLQEKGVDVRWRPVMPGHGEQVRGESYRDRELQRLKREYVHCGYFAISNGAGPEFTGPAEPDADVVVHHTAPELWEQHLDPCAINVACTECGTNRLPAHWAALCETMHRILVPGAFAEQVFARTVSPSKIRVVPYIAREVTAGEEAVRDFRSRYGVPEDHFVFYCMNSWSCRKAPWLTLHAYLQAFRAGDPVTLVIKTGSLGEANYGARRLQGTRELAGAIVSDYPDAPHVCLVNREVPAADIDALHGAADCYISLAHAEGWGLGAFEAGAAGNPVIATGWSGWTEYLSESNAYLIDYELQQARNGVAASPSGQRWAVANLDEAIATMQQVHSDPSSGRSLGRRLQKEIFQRFNSEHVGQLFLDAVK